jgi:hypothetical protein
MSSTEYSVPVLQSHVSRLWQNLHLKEQPCINRIKRIPGPSTAPNVSNE